MQIVSLKALEAVLDDPSVLFARRAVSTLIGLALWGLALFLTAALATWTVGDPSLTHATAEPVRNAMGWPGAAIADPVMQIFGLAAPLAIAPPIVWGFRLLAGRPLGLEPSRIGAGIGALVLSPAFFNAFPAPDSWPLPVGLGGVLGAAWGGLFDAVLGLPAGAVQGFVGGLIGLLALALVVRALSPVRAAPLDAGPGFQIRRHAEPVEDDYGLDETDAFEAEPSRWSAFVGAVLYHVAVLRRRLTRWSPRPVRRAAEPRLRSVLAQHAPTFRDDPDTYRRAADRGRTDDGRAATATDDRDDAWDEDEDDDEPFEDDLAPVAAAPHREAIVGGSPKGAGSAVQRPAAARDPDREDRERQPSRWRFQLPSRGPAAKLEPAALADAAPDERAPPEADDLAAFAPTPRADARWDDEDDDGPWDAVDEDDASDESERPHQRDERDRDGGEDEEDPYLDAIARHGQAPVAAPTRVTPQKRRMTPASGATRARPAPAEGPYAFPPLALLAAPPADRLDADLSEDALEANARELEGVLDDFGVRGSIIEVRPGPVVTLYELEPAPGIKSSRVIGLADDIARSMSAISARVAVIPGKNAIGIELPNRTRVTVFLRELLASEDFARTRQKLPLCLGKTIGGEAVIADLARMPHLLVAGTTGSGKSVSINTMILSLLYHHSPERCRVILIDPKMLELSVYDGIPHLLTPVVTDPKKAVAALKWAVREMEDRYRKMAKLGVRNIDGYNTRLKEAEKSGEPLTRLVQTGFDGATGEAIFEEEVLSFEPMPFIVVIVDEMADLMMVAGKEIEGAIQRLAQMARAAGIHLIMATQRPSVDVITGTIKANFPTRISFQVTSKIDSRTILGEMGAEQLLGMGDMLYMAGGGRITRVHGPFVADEEVEDVVAHMKRQGVPDYLAEVLEDDEEGSVDGAGSLDALAESDDLYDRAVALVLRDRKASTSYVQRRLAIGYNRAATLIERMENEGVVSPANHAGKREILVPAEGEAA